METEREETGGNKANEDFSSAGAAKWRDVLRLDGEYENTANWHKITSTPLDSVAYVEVSSDEDLVKY